MVVTRADIYEKVISDPRPRCPYCGGEMNIMECNDTGFSCGGGWGTPYLFVCVNDACPPFVKGWENMKKGFSRKCSYRCICFPDSRLTELMMVVSRFDGKSQVLEEKVIESDRARGTQEDPEVKKLVTFYESGALTPLLSTLLDARAHYRVRQEAARLIGELGRLEAIEPLKQRPFRDQRVASRVRQVILRIHEVTDTRECPYCAELVDAKAKVCPECGKALPS